MGKRLPIFQLHRLLAQSSHGVSLSRILSALRVSRPTAFRLLKELRESHSAPIEYDRKANTYRYASDVAIELPGSWLNHEEWTMVLGLVQSLGKNDHGPLKPLLVGIREKLSLWSAQLGGDATHWSDKVRFVPIGERKVEKGVLQSVLSALHTNVRVFIVYHSPLSEDGEMTERVISPLHLVRYRDNWYVDAYCHLRNGLRSFSLSQIKSVHLLEDAAIHVPTGESDAFFGESYGIFSGKPKHMARLVFHGEAAKLVSREAWHPNQIDEWLPNGHWQIRFPYGDSRELVRDLSRWADGLVSVEPPSLRKAVVENLKTGFRALQ